jgi:hypothetical protein
MISQPPYRLTFHLEIPDDSLSGGVALLNYDNMYDAIGTESDAPASLSC